MGKEVLTYFPSGSLAIFLSLILINRRAMIDKNVFIYNVIVLILFCKIYNSF